MERVINGRNSKKIIYFVNKNNYENVTIEISDERDFLYNTGGAILKALPLLKDSKIVLIHNVDIVTDVDFESLYNKFSDSDDVVWLLTQKISFR